MKPSIRSTYHPSEVLTFNEWAIYIARTLEAIRRS
jgi:hypothetical protein